MFAVININHIKLKTGATLSNPRTKKILREEKTLYIIFTPINIPEETNP